MLRAGGCEHRRDLADERIARPQPASLVEEGFHLASHHAEHGRRAKDDAVISFEVGRRRDQRVVYDEACLAPNRLGDGFGDTAQIDLGAGHAAGTIGLSLGQRANMAIAGIVENENPGHRDEPFCFRDQSIGSAIGRNGAASAPRNFSEPPMKANSYRPA